MVCPYCNNEITTTGAFCPNCGAQLKQEMKDVQPPSPPKKKNLLPIIGIAAGAAVLIGVAVLVIVLLTAKKPAQTANVNPGTVADVAETGSKPVQNDAKDSAAESLASAEKLLEDGEYEKAEEILLGLNDYEGAAELAAYAAACRETENQNYAKALEAFDALGDFKDAKERADKCREQLTYLDAVEKMNAKDFSAAAELFDAIPGVNDADSLKAECKAQLTNAQIDQLLADGKWADALVLLDSEDGQKYPDRDNVAKDCRNRVDYAAALDAMENKYYYTAYNLFTALGDYEQSRENAALCQRPLPSTGELYRNQEYKRQTVQLNLKNPNDGYYTYVRIYDPQGKTIVSTAFIHPGKTAVIYLPDRSYLLKAAYSKTGDWFGEQEMFGDEAIYKKLFTFELTQVGRYGYWVYTFDDRLEGSTESRTDF